MVDDPDPVASNQPMKNVHIDPISNQNKSTVKNIDMDIEIVLSSKSTIYDFTKKQLSTLKSLETTNRLKFSLFKSHKKWNSP